MTRVWRIFVPFLDVIEIRDEEVILTMDGEQVARLVETLMENPAAEARATSLIADKLDQRYRLLRELDEKNRIEEARGSG